MDVLEDRRRRYRNASLVNPNDPSAAVMLSTTVLSSSVSLPKRSDSGARSAEATASFVRVGAFAADLHAMQIDAFAQIVATLQSADSAPLEIFAADGHGRSYGMASRVLGRELPGILECRLWETLASRPAAPPRS